MSDTHGRPYARLSQLKAGDIVIVDDGFECMKRWAEREVYEVHDGGDKPILAVKCRSGDHAIYVQRAEDGDSLVGIYRKENFDPDKPAARGRLL